MSRKSDRRHAVCLVFSSDFHEDAQNSFDDDFEYYEQYFAKDVLECGFSERDYVLGVFSGVLNERSRLDELISKSADSWDIWRISKIDLAIMRVAVYEMLYMEEISNSVAINEAVEIAKDFSDDASHKFVNGVLAKIGRTGVS